MREGCVCSKKNPDCQGLRNREVEIARGEPLFKRSA